MKDYGIYFLLITLATIIIIPTNCKALSYSTWKNNLEKVAETIQSKNYIYDSDSARTAYYSDMANSKSLSKIKSKKNWLKTAKDSNGKYYKNYYTKTNNYKFGGYCIPYGTGKKNCEYQNYWQKNMANCRKCIELDCSNYCYSGKSKLGFKNCIATLNKGKTINGKWYSAKNPYQENKYCKDIVGYHNKDKIARAYASYRNKTATNNSNKLSKKGMVCHNYIKYALQKSGIYNGSAFHAKASKVSDYSGCSILQGGNYDVFVPEINDKYLDCYTEKVSWLKKNSNNQRPTLKYLAKNGYVKRGDIISQWDGSGEHTEVFMGYDKKSDKITSIYGVGSVYQVNTGTKYGGKYGFGKGTKFLIKSRILSTQKDKRNNHHNPRVAAVIRIR